MLSKNTITRIVVSLAAIPLIVLTCYAGGIYFLALMLLIAFLSFHEFAGITGKKNFFVNVVPGFFAVGAIILNFYFKFSGFAELALAILLIILTGELFRNRQSAIANLGSTFLGVFYIGMAIGSAVAVREFFPQDGPFYNQGGYIIISMLATIWICDSAAFFIGSAYGKHKLFPRVSPKKSWEGAVSGFIFSIISMAAFKEILLEQLSWTDAVVIGVIVGILGQAGDLVESLLKRDGGVKDSSVLIPGHGGFFDRFDSFLFTAPAVYLYLYITRLL